MGSLYRSEEMKLINLFVQPEAAFNCINDLGEAGMVQFKDLNDDVNSFQRKFVSEVRRSDEIERKLRYLEKEMIGDGILAQDETRTFSSHALKAEEMDDLESKLEKLESNLREVNKNQDKLKRNYRELLELKNILKKAQFFFDEQGPPTFEDTSFSTDQDDDRVNLLDVDYQGASSINKTLNFVTGVIPVEKRASFERVLWRSCRGNVFIKFDDIEKAFEDPETGKLTHKSVYVIFFQGSQLERRVRYVCEGFHATIYPCPDNAPARREMAIGVMTRIDDLNQVLERSSEARQLILAEVSTQIKTWKTKVRKTKAIYATLNKFNMTMDKCLIGEGWVASKHVEEVQFIMRRASELSSSTVNNYVHIKKTKEQPPTFHQTDNFTASFQNIIDAYGVASYREINPAPFTIITFPFLFAVMFGDLGHGLIMFLFGFYLVRNERRFLNSKSKSEIWLMIFGGRYLILMMGLFSMYTGFLYNECFAISLNVFGSAWNVSAIKDFDKTLNNTHEYTLDPYNGGPVYRSVGPEPYPKSSGVPYLYGMDPIWQTAENKIMFQNSYKMKSSVILGMTQMLFGLILSYKNIRFFKDKLAFYCEWIPQMIFINCIVGYLCFQIILKWITCKNPNTAPSLLIGLINMFMFTHEKNEEMLLFTGQNQLNNFLVILAFICVPWMLCAKPYILYKRHQKKKQLVTRVDILPTSDNGESFCQHMRKRNWEFEIRRRHLTGNDYQLVNVDDSALLNNDDQLSNASSEDSNDSATRDKHEFNMGEVIIYQVIHTIEYCLNCISHTASYLRLWALSLAHSELSEVLWKMIMHIGLTILPNSLIGSMITYSIFGIFVALTVGILLGMEGLSAFLHALRLHWVEFQVKFYKGQGEKFEPFSFREILQQAENTDAAAAS